MSIVLILFLSNEIYALRPMFFYHSSADDFWTKNKKKDSSHRNPSTGYFSHLFSLAYISLVTSSFSLTYYNVIRRQDGNHFLLQKAKFVTTMVRSQLIEFALLLIKNFVLLFYSQNDLKEFHSLVDVCNPGILGKCQQIRIVGLLD